MLCPLSNSVCMSFIHWQTPFDLLSCLQLLHLSILETQGTPHNRRPTPHSLGTPHSQPTPRTPHSQDTLHSRLAIPNRQLTHRVLTHSSKDS